MNIQTIISAINPLQVIGLDQGLNITGISLDSRRVKSGHLFVALPGTQTDGSKYAKDAEAKGASAILTESSERLTSLPQIVVANARVAMAFAAKKFHREPDRKLRLGAVTGTNGKSTVAYLVRHLLRSSQTRTGMLGTIEYDLGGSTLPASMTTPDAPDLYAALRVMRANRCEACIMEVSSHALTQHRTEGLHFDTGIFTNLTQDHLDYHRTMSSYRDAKGILFRQLPERGYAILNMDDEAGQHYAKETKAQVLGYSTKGNHQAELRATIRQMDIHGTTFWVESPWGHREVRWPMVGAHNVENALAALGASLVLGTGYQYTFNFDFALAALERFAGMPGRLEPVGDGLLPFRTFVDYAHTDDALQSVLSALKELKPGRVIVVFGCGGDRDKGKRPKMGRAVEQLADLGVVTSDNPRSENPNKIIADIWTGIENWEKFIVEPDRARAINLAIKEARKGDVVLVAGKGHETYQIVGDETLPFDDRETALQAMRDRKDSTKTFYAVAGD